MRQISVEELKEIQLNLLKNIDLFCKSNGIVYFLAYGTLIGAVRHNGYIPWDDDIDIAMPRPDYDRFIKLFNAFDKDYQVEDLSITENYPTPFAKVVDTRTEMRMTLYNQRNSGVYIDVFPIDGIGDSKQIDKTIRLNKFLNAKKAVINRKRSFSKNLLLLIGKIVLTFLTVSSIIKKIDRISRQYDYSECKKVGLICCPYGTCEIVDKDCFKSTVIHTFETLEVSIPVGYDKWLRSIYGDYMKLPPVEKRVSHHDFEVWWRE